MISFYDTLKSLVDQVLLPRSVRKGDFQQQKIKISGGVGGIRAPSPKHGIVPNRPFFLINELRLNSCFHSCQLTIYVGIISKYKNHTN